MPLPQVQEKEAVTKDVDLLAKELETLRLSYDQYFLGLEKKPPTKQREKVIAIIRKYSGVVIQNVRAKFKFQQTIARYNTYTVLWDRVLREMEEGKYTRDVFRAKLHEEERGIKSKPTKVDPVAALFAQYIETRKKNNESTQGLSLNSFQKTLQTQIETIKSKTKASGVRFQVTTEEGKTKIKAIPQLPKK